MLIIIREIQREQAFYL